MLGEAVNVVENVPTPVPDGSVVPLYDARTPPGRERVRLTFASGTGSPPEVTSTCTVVEFGASIEAAPTETATSSRRYSGFTVIVVEAAGPAYWGLVTVRVTVASRGP